jgi:hypothetical protein
MDSLVYRQIGGARLVERASAGAIGARCFRSAELVVAGASRE